MVKSNLYSKFGDLKSFTLRNLCKQEKQLLNIHMIKSLLRHKFDYTKNQHFFMPLFSSVFVVMDL